MVARLRRWWFVAPHIPSTKWLGFTTTRRNDMRLPVLRYNALEHSTCAWLRSGVCEAGPLVDVAWLDWPE
jgi:hypothetical protein